MDPASALINYGVAGIVVVLLALGVLVPGPMYRREREENDRRGVFMEGKFVDTLTDATRALEAAQRSQIEMAELVRDMRTEVRAERYERARREDGQR